MRVTVVAAIILGLGALAVLALCGGAQAYARPVFESIAVLALLLTALGMGRRFRIPPLSWLALAFAPAAAVMILQVVPVGWHHPWITPDQQLLQASTSQWSLDPAATTAALAWTLALAAAGLVWHVSMRSERARVLAYVALGVTMAHAVVGLVLALAAVDWPTAASGFVVRGCFVYQNQAAAFSGCVLPLAILLAREQRRAWLWFGVGALALAVILSTSRGGILVTSAVCLPVVWFSLPRRRRVRYFALVVGAISLYLAAIGLHEVSLKFGRLIGPEGLTLDGRLIIWRDTLPLIGQASPLGTGVDTTQDVWWRTGNTAFPGLTINHIHSDPLEWLLEFGWGGALVIVAGLAVLAWRMMASTATRGDPLLWRGSVLGLAILLVHSCADFLWNREAIALMAVVLVILALEARDDYHQRQARHSLWLRLLCAGLALALACLLPLAWILDDEAATIGTVQRLVDGRQASHLTIDSATVREALTRPARGVHLATEQARLALDLAQPGATAVDPDEQGLQELYRQAAEHLRQAALLAPGNPGAWVERARLASLAPALTTPSLRQALERILVLAPSWDYAEAIVLDCMRRGATSSIPQETRRRLIGSVLNLDRPQPAWFFLLANGQLEPGALARRLTASDCPRSLAASAQWWLATYAPRDDYLTVWRRLAPAQVILPASLELLVPEFGTAASSVTLAVPLQAETRRGSADALSGAGLPLPASLSQALVADGLPWRLWAAPMTVADQDTAARLVRLLATELYRPWAESWFEAATNAQLAWGGTTLRLNADADPRLLAALLDHGRGLLPGERSRLEELLHAHREAHWQEFDQVHWSWLWCDSQVRPLIRTAQWQGWVVDGRWLGWRRGLITSDGLTPGLHRVALLAAPVW